MRHFRASARLAAHIAAPKATIAPSSLAVKTRLDLELLTANLAHPLWFRAHLNR